MLISLENASKLFAERVIFMGVNLKIEENDRIGLVGVNGVGKSTLLNVLDGSLAVDEGERAVRKGLRIGFLHQNSGIDANGTIFEEMRSVFRPILDAQQAMKRLAAQMGQYTDHADSEYLAITDEYNRLQSYFEANEGYQIEVKIKTILNGMGFGDREMDTICSTLSGGEKTRLALAKLLLSEPELLILDEPTNHLDFATLQWLEEYLQSYKGALVVVSHDRYFLDKICTKIWELANLHFTSYKGNYTKYTHTRQMLYERQVKEYEMQQAHVAKLTDYIARNKVRASTSGMAKSKEKQLERMEVLKQPPKPLHSARMAFRFEREPVKDIMHVQGLTMKVGNGSSERTLCDQVDFDLLRGEKVALVGSNGVGKSTFLKTVLGQLEADKGRIQWGKNVKIAYFEQEQLDLHPYKTVLSEVWDRFPATYEQDIRNVLGNLLFSGESVYKEVGKLSGGEKARLKFAIMMYEEGNVLLLDEPTNHLDLSTKEVLDKALMEYEGTILMVSHDRYLLSRMPSRIVEMYPDGFVSYSGGYESYLEKSRGRAVLEEKQSESMQKPKKETEYYRSKKQRAQAVARKKRLLQVEQTISDLETQIAQAQQEMCDPVISCDYQKVASICQQLEEKRTELSDRMEEWAELSEDLA